MKGLRSLTSLLSSAALVLVASDANAATYFTFAGKFTSNRGRIINIPAVGNTPCASGILTVMTGTQMGIPMTMTLAPVPFTRKVNTQPTMMTAGGKVTGGFDVQCVKHAPGKLLQTTAGTAMMGAVGGAFTLPPKVWYDMLPGTLPAVEVKYITAIAQLATSFKISGPNPATMLMEARAPGTMAMTGVNMQSTTGGTMATAGNLAPWLKFDKLSMIPVGMRSGRVPGPAGFTGKFTWCPGGMFACVNVASAPLATKAIVKYVGGGNQFGGTMSYLITTGPNTSSLALNPAGSTAAAAFLVLAGSGSQPTGRGYAQLGTDQLMSGPQFSMHMEMVVTKYLVGMQKLFTSVMNPVAPFPMATNFNYGFPFTTMKVIARNTGTALGNPMVTTVTADGSDVVTAMGGRNIQLVAGGIGITNLLMLGSQTPEIASMLLTLPEPGATLQMLSGVLGLLAIAGWRARKVR